MSAPPPRRKPNRLSEFNYREPGMYFVTPCTHMRVAHFGSVLDGQMRTNAIGDMVADVWQSIPLSFPKVTLDSWVVMPNHLHGLILLDSEHIESNPLLGDVMKWFNSITTNRYIHGVRDAN